VSQASKIEATSSYQTSAAPKVRNSTPTVTSTANTAISAMTIHSSRRS
jgi:hypothetical protein